MERVKTIVVTGGAGHLGKSVARWWIKSKAHIVLIDRDAEKLELLRRELAGLGATVTIIVADLSLRKRFREELELLPELLWAHPPSLVLTHGLSGKDRGLEAPKLEELQAESFQTILEANLISVVYTIQTMLPFMRRASGGRIVLIASTAGVSASPTAALSYSIAKAGVAALPRLLAPQLASSRVLINAVAPGKFSNPDWPDDPARVRRYENSIPLGRLALADEIAALVGFLSSGANTYLTGQTILQDGGRLSGVPPG